MGFFQAAGNHMDGRRFTRPIQWQRINHVGNLAVIDVRRNGAGADIQHVLAHGHLPRLDQPLGKQLDLDPGQAAELADLHRWPVLHCHRLLVTLCLLEGDDAWRVQRDVTIGDIHHQLIIAGFQIIEMDRFTGLGADRNLFGVAA
ncbi:hypothetical protein D3C84_310060 [compost metagenome]